MSVDPFNYGNLPGWTATTAEKTINITAQPIAKQPKYFSLACGVGACFGVLFLAQLLLAIASGDLKGYRARSIDTASMASGVGAIVLGVVVWRKRQ